MAKIRVTQVSIGMAGDAISNRSKILLLDDMGRVWLKEWEHGPFTQVELPDEPVE